MSVAALFGENLMPPVIPQLAPDIPIHGFLAQFPVVPRAGTSPALAWDCCHGVRGCIGQVLLKKRLNHLFSHTNETPSWWLRVDVRKRGMLQVVLAMTGAAIRYRSELERALCSLTYIHQYARNVKERQVSLGAAQTQSLPAMASLAERTALLLPSLVRLQSLAPVVLTKKEVLTPETVTVADIIVACARRLDCIDGGVRYHQLPAHLPATRVQASSAIMSCHDAQLRGMHLTITIGDIPEVYREIVVAGCLVNIGRMASAGAGSFSPE